MSEARSGPPPTPIISWNTLRTAVTGPMVRALSWALVTFLSFAVMEISIAEHTVCWSVVSAPFMTSRSRPAPSSVSVMAPLSRASSRVVNSSSGSRFGPFRTRASSAQALPEQSAEVASRLHLVAWPCEFIHRALEGAETFLGRFVEGPVTRLRPVVPG